MEFLGIKEYRVLVEASDDEHSIEFEEIEGSAPVAYPIDWLNKEGIHPARAKRIRMPDSSMAPLIPEGDAVLVNTADIVIQSGKIYAFGFMNDFLIKRIFKDREGAIILRSDNPEHEPRDEFMAYQCVFDHLCVIGRVIETQLRRKMEISFKWEGITPSKEQKSRVEEEVQKELPNLLIDDSLKPDTGLIVTLKIDDAGLVFGNVVTSNNHEQIGSFTQSSRPNGDRVYTFP